MGATGATASAAGLCAAGAARGAAAIAATVGLIANRRRRAAPGASRL
jgi:hypothetical protein